MTQPKMITVKVIPSNKAPVPKYTKDNIDEYWDLSRLWPSVLIQLVNDALMDDSQGLSPTDEVVRTSARAFFKAKSGEVAEHRELILYSLGYNPERATRAVLSLIEGGTTQKDLLKIRDIFEKNLKLEASARRKKERVT